MPSQDLAARGVVLHLHDLEHPDLDSRPSILATAAVTDAATGHEMLTPSAAEPSVQVVALVPVTLARTQASSEPMD